MPSVGRRVVARKFHRCDTCDRAGRIKPGQVYYQSTIFPGDDYYYGKAPYRFKECAFCSERYGRDWILYPMPPDQEQAVYLNAMQQGRG